MKTFNIGDTAYMVVHCPWWPSEKEKAEVLKTRYEVVDEAFDREKRDIFPSLTKALSFARKAVKKDFWQRCEIIEVRLSNPYPEDIPDTQLKRSALVWEPTGEYECEIESSKTPLP